MGYVSPEYQAQLDHLAASLNWPDNDSLSLHAELALNQIQLCRVADKIAHYNGEWTRLQDERTLIINGIFRTL